MNALLETQSASIVTPREMQDGDIGVIVYWDGLDDYCGRIIQKYGDGLVSVGLKQNESWTDVPVNSSEYKIRILQPGEKIVIGE